jgi:NAD(P)-dependent dehydrogenase (short-subunit alcohol dehydrogenase family)
MNMTRPLEGRTALITGGNQGLGLAIARAYATAGASVFMCARDAALLETARADVSRLATGGQVVRAQPADVSRQDDVEALAKAVFETFPQLHILVNNAGVYGPMGLIEDVDWDGWVRAIQINLFGSILVCRALLRHFKEHRYGKIVQLSGGGATNPLPRISAYAASKAAIVRFSETLAEEVRGEGIDVNSIAPGPLNTRLLDEVLAVGPEKVGRAFYERSLKQKEQGGAPPDRGAALAVFLGSAASDGITGKLLSAVWDPWERLGEHLGDLQRTDVYTLRRIVPGDRGLPWGDKK